MRFSYDIWHSAFSKMFTSLCEQLKSKRFSHSLFCPCTHSQKQHKTLFCFPKWHIHIKRSFCLAWNELQSSHTSRNDNRQSSESVQQKNGRVDGRGRKKVSEEWNQYRWLLTFDRLPILCFLILFFGICSPQSHRHKQWMCFYVYKCVYVREWVVWSSGISKCWKMLLCLCCFFYTSDYIVSWNNTIFFTSTFYNRVSLFFASCAQ